jgi:holo-[acyl-carrier protein] synthase
MIIGLGIDTIEIERFALWHTYSIKKLRRIFSDEEIIYCLQEQKKSAQRFAVRFAAREALYKALSYAYPDKKIPFLTLCTHTVIKKIDERPVLALDNKCGIDSSLFMMHLSLSHSRMQAVACIIIESQ